MNLPRLNFARLNFARMPRVIMALLAGLVAAGSVHAERHGSVAFALDPITTLAPSLEAPRPPGTQGSWVRGNYIHGSLSSGHANGDNVRHDWFSSPNGLDYDPPFGMAIDKQQAPLPGELLSTQAQVSAQRLSAGWKTDLPTDSAWADITWQRFVKLDPYASLTLSGVATLDRSFANPLTVHYQTDVLGDEYPSTATLTLSDDLVFRHGVSLEVLISNRDPLDYHAGSQGRVASTDDFTYSADSFGALSLTVHNHSALPMFASLSVLAFTSAQPIPEPATAWMLALGVGWLAWRRGSPRNAA